jgi:hypothetical protein
LASEAVGIHNNKLFIHKQSLDNESSVKFNKNAHKSSDNRIDFLASKRDEKELRRQLDSLEDTLRILGVSRTEYANGIAFTKKMVANDIQALLH